MELLLRPSTFTLVLVPSASASCVAPASSILLWFKLTLVTVPARTSAMALSSSDAMNLALLVLSRPWF